MMEVNGLRFGKLNIVPQNQLNQKGNVNLGEVKNNEKVEIRDTRDLFLNDENYDDASVLDFEPPEDGSWTGYVGEQWRYYNEEQQGGWENMQYRYRDNEMCAVTDLLMTLVVGTFKWAKSKM